MEQGREMTVEQGIQELFDRVLSLEAKCMAQTSLIGVLVTVVAGMPHGIGIPKMNESLEMLRSGLNDLPLQEKVGVRKMVAIMNALYDNMIVNSNEVNKKVRFEVIDGGKDS